jgi:hypothetical protein
MWIKGKGIEGMGGRLIINKVTIQKIESWD